MEDSIAAMKSGDPAGRYRAADELGRLIEGSSPPAEAVTAMGTALDDSDPRVRRMAVAVLGGLGPGAAAAQSDLIRATRDPDEMVRRLASWAMVRTTPVRRKNRPG